jgi:hypothetical protein
MIYGDRDPVQRSENLTEFAPMVEVVNLDLGGTGCNKRSPKKQTKRF